MGQKWGCGHLTWSTGSRPGNGFITWQVSNCRCILHRKRFLIPLKALDRESPGPLRAGLWPRVQVGLLQQIPDQFLDAVQDDLVGAAAVFRPVRGGEGQDPCHPQHVALLFHRNLVLLQPKADSGPRPPQLVRAAAGGPGGPEAGLEAPGGVLVIGMEDLHLLHSMAHHHLHLCSSLSEVHQNQTEGANAHLVRSWWLWRPPEVTSQPVRLKQRFIHVTCHLADTGSTVCSHPRSSWLFATFTITCLDT